MTCDTNACAIFGGCCHSLEVRKPFVLLWRSIRDEERAEGAHERRMLVAPAMLHQRQKQICLLDLIKRAAFVSTLCIAAVQNEFGDPFGVSRGVGNRDSRAL